jgi:hypothetical protein
MCVEPQLDGGDQLGVQYLTQGLRAMVYQVALLLSAAGKNRAMTEAASLD